MQYLCGISPTKCEKADHCKKSFFEASRRLFVKEKIEEHRFLQLTSSLNTDPRQKVQVFSVRGFHRFATLAFAVALCGGTSCSGNISRSPCKAKLMVEVPEQLIISDHGRVE
mmetsp:Transcript_109731/g.171651  ORF Transcript_109731/g.171651 Transcript_109731/m.171651 type:complete len:112 (-) Transcript_109731:232-567(-)